MEEEHGLIQTQRESLFTFRSDITFPRPSLAVASTYSSIHALELATNDALALSTSSQGVWLHSVPRKYLEDCMSIA